MINKLPTSALLLALLLTSCKTYYIPIECFKQQFAERDSAGMREVTAGGPMGGRVKYKAYPIDSIHAIDKNGNPIIIQNSPAIEVRITDTANKKTIFYFDRIWFDGENITGGQSRFISSMKKKIPIGEVKTIEVQNGRKNFKYVQ